MSCSSLYISDQKLCKWLENPRFPIPLVAKGWTPSSILSKCEGDCNYHSDCDVEDYLLYTRTLLNNVKMKLYESHLSLSNIGPFPLRVCYTLLTKLN